MDRKSKVLVFIIIIFITLTVMSIFYKTIILQDFELRSEMIEK